MPLLARRSIYLRDNPGTSCNNVCAKMVEYGAGRQKGSLRRPTKTKNQNKTCTFNSATPGKKPPNRSDLSTPIRNHRTHPAHASSLYAVLRPFAATNPTNGSLIRFDSLGLTPIRPPNFPDSRQPPSPSQRLRASSTTTHPTPASSLLSRSSRSFAVKLLQPNPTEFALIYFDRFDPPPATALQNGFLYLDLL